MSDPSLPKTVLPPNASALEVALDQSMARAFPSDLGLEFSWSAQDCPAPLLPFLAWALSVDVWKDSWAEPTKRSVIASSVFVHRHKGTAAAVTKALDALNYGVELSEWFEHDGDPYTFRAEVRLDRDWLSPLATQSIFETIEATKNARSWLEALRVFFTVPSTRYRAVGIMTGQTLSIGAYHE